MAVSNTRDHRASRWRPLVVLLSSLVLLWPALINGGPFLFPDSIEYIRGPDGALGKLLGPNAKSLWSRPRPAVPGAPALTSHDQTLVGTPRTGRSIYYGVLANLGARSGGLWLTLLLQAWGAALAIDLLCRALGWTDIRVFCLTMALAAVLTPLPVFAGFVMADVFAAIMVTVAAAMAAGADRLSRTDIGVGAGLIAYAAVTHRSHLAILAAILAASGLLWLIRRRDAAVAKGAAVLAGVGVAALAAAVIAGLAFDLAVRKAFGEPPIQVPYLTARMVGDAHPGQAWLQRRCPEAGFVVCRIAGRLPMTPNDFLWSADPVKSAFTTSSLADQEALGREQTRFALAVVREEPLAVARAFLVDWAAQLRSVSLEDMNLTEAQRANIDPLLPEAFAGTWRSRCATSCWVAWPSAAPGRLTL